MQLMQSEQWSKGRLVLFHNKSRGGRSCVTADGLSPCHSAKGALCPDSSSRPHSGGHLPLMLAYARYTPSRLVVPSESGSDAEGSLDESIDGCEHVVDGCEHVVDTTDSDTTARLYYDKPPSQSRRRQAIDKCLTNKKHRKRADFAVELSNY